MPKRTRDLEGTRKKILHAAFEEIYVHGFQGTSLEQIVQRAKMTKGALFNLFSNKLELGYAVVEEVISEMILAQWSEPLKNTGDCLEAIAVSFETGAKALMKMEQHHGCPLNNLAQEMSNLDEGFKNRVNRIFETWTTLLQQSLEDGKKKKVVRKNVNTKDAAVMLVSLVEGTLSLAKSSQSPEVLKSGSRNIRYFLETLR